MQPSWSNVTDAIFRYTKERPDAPFGSMPAAQ